MVKPTQWKSYKFSAHDYEDYIDLPRLDETLIEKFHKRIDTAACKAVAGALEDFRNSIDVSIHGTDDDGANMKIVLWDDNATDEIMTIKLMDLIDEYLACDGYGDVPADAMKEQAEHLTRVADRIRSAASKLLSRANAPPKVTSAVERRELAPEKSSPS